MTEPQRREFTFTRTICACDECKTYCAHLSGMVAPWDLLRWEQAQHDGFAPWMLSMFAASPGAKVVYQGDVLRIPTIVPARLLMDGQCVFLTAEHQCRIHTTAPYGCAYFDHSQSREEGNQRSQIALAAILYDWHTQGPYSTWWLQLEQAGKIVEAPETVRRHMAEEG